MRSLLYILAAILAIMIASSGAGSDPSGNATIYLGKGYYQEPVKLGGTGYSSPEQSNEFRSSFGRLLQASIIPLIHAILLPWVP